MFASGVCPARLLLNVTAFKKCRWNEMCWCGLRQTIFKVLHPSPKCLVFFIREARLVCLYTAVNIERDALFMIHGSIISIAMLLLCFQHSLDALTNGLCLMFTWNIPRESFHPYDLFLMRVPIYRQFFSLPSLRRGNVTLVTVEDLLTNLTFLHFVFHLRQFKMP